jgi:hypothetical protein
MFSILVELGGIRPGDPRASVAMAGKNRSSAPPDPDNRGEALILDGIRGDD